MRALRSRAKRSKKESRRLLIGGEARLSALRHVGHHLDLAAEIGIGVPGRGQPAEIGLGEAVRVAILAQIGPASAIGPPAAWLCRDKARRSSRNSRRSAPTSSSSGRYRR